MDYNKNIEDPVSVTRVCKNCGDEYTITYKNRMSYLRSRRKYCPECLEKITTQNSRNHIMRVRRHKENNKEKKAREREKALATGNVGVSIVLDAIDREGRDAAAQIYDVQSVIDAVSYGDMAAKRYMKRLER